MSRNGITVETGGRVTVVRLRGEIDVSLRDEAGAALALGLEHVLAPGPAGAEPAR